MQKAMAHGGRNYPGSCGSAARKLGARNEVTLPQCNGTKNTMERGLSTRVHLSSGKKLAVPARRRKTQQSSSPEPPYAATPPPVCSDGPLNECQISCFPNISRQAADQSAIDSLRGGNSYDRGEAGGAPSRLAAQGGEESSEHSSQSEVPDTQIPWASRFMTRTGFGSEERLGLTTIVSTVGSWVAAAFEDHEEQKDVENEEDTSASGDPYDDSRPTSPESVPASPAEGEQAAADAMSLEPPEIPANTLLLAEAVAFPLGVECSPEEERTTSSTYDPHLQPRVLLHLCGQPAPILWSATDPVPPVAEVPVLSEEPGIAAQEIDPHFLHVPLPSLHGETDSPLEPPVSQKSLDDIAKEIEMWLLDTEARRLASDARREGSVCSSESSDEGIGERLLDFAQVSAYFVGRGQAEEARRDSEDALGSLHWGLTLFQPLEIKSSSPTECSPASSVSLSVLEDETLAANDFRELPALATGKPAGAEEASASSVPAGPATSTDNNGPVAKEEMPTCEVLNRASHHGSDHTPSSMAGLKKSKEDNNMALPLSGSDERAELSVHGGMEAGESGNPSPKREELAACGSEAHSNGSVLMRENGSSSELTPEEAAAKEAAARSLGNRIWAFFGGATGAEGDAGTGEGPTSGDAVEETIPFEDPAVVQRDDHRAFPNETQLLLESIRQQPQLQVLSPQQQKYLASLMRREVVAFSTRVAEEGAEPSLLWCNSGEFDVTQAGFFGVSVLRTLTPGSFFGVEEVVAGEKLTCALTSRQSSSECVLWVLDRELYLDSVKDMLTKRQAFVPVAQTFLHMVPLVRDLPDEQIAAVAKACKVERFVEGQTVFKMGFHGDMLCFIYRGEAITQKPQDDGALLELARQGRGEYFGEMALIRNARRTASVVAGTELLLLCLDKESFEALLAPLKEKMAAKAASSYKRQDDAPPTESDSTSAEGGGGAAPVPGSREAGETYIKKRTRKSSLALLNYSKIRDQEKQAEEGQGDAAEEKSTSRWRLAEEPKAIHEPPPLSTTGGRSCLKENSPQSRGRARKSPVRFDEGSLLPSESSSDEG